MNEKIEIGKINTLKVNRVSEPGIYLISGDETEVLLPNAYVEKSMLVDSLLDVFIYTDSEDRLVATTLKPYLYLHEFAFLKVVDTAKFGAFVDIGLPKDILVPKNRQKSSFFVGSYKVLQLQLDEKTNRLIASEKYDLLKKIRNLEKNDEVEIILYSKTPLGYKVIVNNRYEGMIFHSEVFENLKIGDKKRAYVKNVREDNKLDISLQKIGQKIVDDKVFQVLEKNGGKLNFTYKSEAEDIKEVFGISKKSFKASLTKLLSENKIILEENCIRIK
ncbi:CvfB family protein [Aliarcobacter butzleri]|uniref:S1-like domain-containing RNA-binding protein n=1 Tax=Aliarcobacter butzleri TaxID=28197 RepID=A0AAW7PN30_9BACT|nr:S1-like domain-containing RNA-binding protein [Aliarcobacter butzleri]MCT7594093.1 S1-like domain-containing RNA-binding protein [Aliarcobacter butzleri]MCT7599561.1 S1-like domain-containing RNA-binding protein [Aliarcobacter butzleri]MCT7600602.1 S1-like domain-containing RNA-binding protein [Aliarcobacter butzleri]MCT7605045.1 S1-like domain-containing RNA-binding protein [Aliarcobacter butzleri]MCT7607689.1 S1-like domain-containing RNA-binding protein [Aliarcobacter butzleri]